MQLAVAMELIHSATLVHDDIVDGNPLRRGQPTVARRHGPRLAVALGDYYFAKAARILAEMGVNEVTATVLDGVTRVCRAQLLEMESRGLIPTEEVYVEVATGKTAALLASGCVAGAQLSRASPEVVGAIRGFGERIGLAFQMIDDLVDLEPDGTGKPVGQDIRGGVASLPVIYALREKTWAGELESLLGEPDGVDRALDLVRRSGAVDAVRRRAASLAAEALGQLERIPDSRARRDLEAIAQLAVQRRA
jgi:geranylgeranyl pyrophosphate synthase